LLASLPHRADDAAKLASEYANVMNYLGVDAAGLDISAGGN
jgi:hypothetical protein